MPAAKSKKAPVRTAYHHGNLRQALVEAGLAHLESAERGEISLRELARQVGVTANAVYRHFADKEALLAALAAEGFRRLREAQVAAEQPGRDPADTLHTAGRSYIAFARANPALYRLMFGRFDSTTHGSELAEAARASFAKLLAQVAVAQQLSPDDPKVLEAAVFGWGLTHGLSQLALDGQFDHLTSDPDALIDAAMRFGAPRRK
ncbi:MAG TPA: TetR/AcrR family transcriptional regulator [Nevskiaceae bacterium]|nr:TetR/AcrR family transcriptional regulator [Nevskiaceae bacterium]